MKEGWEMKKLGEVCRLVNGRAYKKVELLSEGKYPVLRVGNLFTKNQWYYSNLELDEDKYCDNQDLIYAWSASFGPRIWEGGKVIYHYHIWKVIPNFQLVTRDYLYHLFEWDKEQIKSAHGTGTTMMHVGKGSMENRVLPIPPLAEQKQIVTLLESTFTKIDQAKANIEKNITNAKELFQSKLNEIFSQKGDGWEEKTLGEVCELISGQHINSNDYNIEGKGIGYLTGPSDYGELHPTVSKWTEHPKRTALINDILITVKGSGVGSINLMKEKELCISRQIMSIRCNEVLTGYMYSFLSTQFEHFQSVANGAAIPGISRDDVLNLKLLIPEKRVQKNVVKQILELRDGVKLLDKKFNDKLQNLEELKKSLLQKAFAGELTQLSEPVILND